MRLRNFLRLPTLYDGPRMGITPDNAALFGVIGGMNNANAYCGHLEQITTAGTNTTLTGKQCRRRVLYLNSGASGGFTITLPSTAAILSALGPTIFYDNTYGQPFVIVNNGVGQTGTLTAGDASTTITGTATIATNTARTFFLMVTAASTITYFNCGSMSL